MKNPARPPQLKPVEYLTTTFPKADDERPADFVPEWLKKKTFRVEYSPNCPSPYLVRLVGKGKYRITGDKTDACGYGKTLQQAADNALKEQERSDEKFLA